MGGRNECPDFTHACGSTIASRGPQSTTSTGETHVVRLNSHRHYSADSNPGHLASVLAFRLSEQAQALQDSIIPQVESPKTHYRSALCHGHCTSSLQLSSCLPTPQGHSRYPLPASHHHYSRRCLHHGPRSKPVPEPDPGPAVWCFLQPEPAWHPDPPLCCRLLSLSSASTRHCHQAPQPHCLSTVRWIADPQLCPSSTQLSFLRAGWRQPSPRHS